MNTDTTIKCVVACFNSNGEPELVHVAVSCTQYQVNDGEHYGFAKAAVEGLGFENPAWVADENDPGYVRPEGELHLEGPPTNWTEIDIAQHPPTPAHILAYEMIPATCSKVGAILNTLRQAIVQAGYQVEVDNQEALDKAVTGTIKKLRKEVTEPLRRALIYMCDQYSIASRD